MPTCGQSLHSSLKSGGLPSTNNRYTEAGVVLGAQSQLPDRPGFAAGVVETWLDLLNPSFT